MLIFIDKKIPEQAKDKLAKYGEIVELASKDITYNAISGHPDIFLSKTSENIFIVAPNAPEIIFQKFSEYNKEYVKGIDKVGKEYPFTALYNAVFTDSLFIHNFKISDFSLINAGKNKEHISIRQGYCRCNLISLHDKAFITSDPGIYKELKGREFHVLLVKTEGILLEDFRYGFFGGTCGIIDDKLLIIGSLKYYKDGDEVKNFVKKMGLNIVELYDGLLFDGGGIIS
ncbi:MAG: hypothetical protein Q8880_01835 [Bacteroidota bacterium]|nr:hypothetical protein [Bacteroidota bacterium]